MKLKSILILCTILAVAGVVYLIVSNPKKVETPVEYQPFVWDFNMDALQYIQITLPRAENTADKPNTQTWIKHDDRYFYFDVVDGTKVDMNRWGGGIPLILSGPSAARVIYENLPENRLAEFGFDVPSIYVDLKLNDNAEYHILVGNSTPGGSDYYIKMATDSNIYTVDKSWYEVIAALVTNPPYQPAVITVQGITYSPVEPVANQPFIIKAKVVNTGVLANPTPVDMILKFQGETISIVPVSALPGVKIGSTENETTVDFSMTAKPAGTYSININGKTAKLVIK